MLGIGTTAQLGIKVVTDMAGAARDLNKTSGIVGKLAGVGKVAAAGVAVATGAVTALGVSAVNSAGDLEQSIGAIDVVFKDSAGTMHQWAATAAQDVGLTKNEFNELGTLIGTQLKNGGTAMDELAPKTNELIGLGADLSAMFGGTTADAVGALSSALKGERDPIERFGVTLNQAAVDAKAAELGFEKVGGALSAEANQAATLALIMEQTADAHGTFAREADTLQGRQQRLSAELENTKAAIGMALLPAVTGLLEVFRVHFMPVIGRAADAIIGFIDTFDFSEVLGGFRAFVAAFQAGDGDITSAGFPGWMEQAAYIARVAFDTIGAGIGLLVDWFTSTLQPAVEGLVGAFQDRFNAIVQIGSDLVAGLQGYIEPLAPQIEAIFSTIGDIITGAVEVITEVWNLGTEFLLAAWDAVGPALTDFIGTTWQTIVGIIGPAMDTISAIIDTVLAAIRGDWSGVWNGIQDIATGVWNTIKGIISGAINQVSTIISGVLSTITGLWSRGWNTIKSNLSTAWSAIKSAVSTGTSNVLGYFRDLPGRILDAIRSLPSRMRGVGGDIMRGLINGVKGMASRVVGSVRGVIDDAIGAAKRLLGIASPSRVFTLIGQQTGQGLAGGLRGMASDVTRASRHLIDAAIPDRAPEIPVSLTATGGRTASAGATHVHLHIDGALIGDARSLARELRDLLNGDARVRGVVSLGGKVLG